MSGAGSLILMNYLANRAPRDGTVMGMPTTNVLLDSKLRLPGAEKFPFEINRASWIGSTTGIYSAGARNTCSRRPPVAYAS